MKRDQATGVGHVVAYQVSHNTTHYGDASNFRVARDQRPHFFLSSLDTVCVQIPIFTSFDHTSSLLIYLKYKSRLYSLLQLNAAMSYIRERRRIPKYLSRRSQTLSFTFKESSFITGVKPITESRLFIIKFFDITISPKSLCY